MKVKLVHTTRISDRDTEVLRVYFRGHNPKPLSDRRLADLVRDTMKLTGICRINQIVEEVGSAIKTEEVTE